MLQDIRNNAQSTAAKVVVWVIVISFALFGVESIVGGLSGEPEVATVNGEGVPESNFMRAVESKRRQIIAQMGERADPELIDEALLRNSVLEGMIQEEILAQDASDKGLYVADAFVDSYIRNVEQFQVDGQFSNERLQMILRNAGLTLKDYRDSIKKQFVLSQTRSGLIASAFVLENERDELVAIDRQERTFGFLTVSKQDYLDAIAVSDEEVASYYESNKSKYKKPENVDVSYVEINKLDLAASVDVSDDELLSLYESEKADFVGEEERHAAHILIKIDEDRSEDEALKKISEISEKLGSGESFSALASEFSEDEGSASEGGDLGFSGKGVYVSDFEDALYKLSVGQISEPVKTEFGYHLIQLLAVEKNDAPSFEELKSQLLSRVQDEKANQLYAEKTEQLADLSYASPDLAEPADELGLPVKELVGVSAQSTDSIFSNIKVQRVLFSDDLIKDQNNSELIEVADGRAIVFRVNAYHEESIMALDQVSDLVREELVSQKASEYANSVGQAFIVRVVAGESPQAVADDMGLSWKLHEDIRRNDIVIDQDVLSRVFSIKLSDNIQDNVQGFETGNGDYAVVMLTSVSEGDVSEVTALEKQSISSMIGNSYGAGDYRSYQDVMVRDAEIERL